MRPEVVAVRGPAAQQGPDAPRRVVGCHRFLDAGFVEIPDEERRTARLVWTGVDPRHGDDGPVLQAAKVWIPLDVVAARGFMSAVEHLLGGWVPVIVDAVRPWAPVVSQKPIQGHGGR